MTQSLARRVADLNNTLANLKASTITLTRFRDDLLVSIATICKLEGFDVHVYPLVAEGVGDMTVVWKQKDVKHPISKAEHEEVAFRVASLEAMGFRKPTLVAPDAHTLKYEFKVK